MTFLAVAYGLAAALAWGTGDFAGGMAARRSGNALLSVFHAEWIGLVALLAVMVWQGEPMMSLRGALLAILAGAVGSLALMALYQAMSEGQMSIAAPVSALLGASLPVAVGIWREGWPDALTLMGFPLALAAVWLVSTGEGGLNSRLNWKPLLLPLTAGVGFGLYFLLMHDAAQEARWWPLFLSRSGGMTVLLAFALLRRMPLRFPRQAWSAALVNGLFDVSANGLYVLAAQTGRMDVAVVLSSLYPGMTVFWAWLLLKEKMGGWQKLGIALALAAIGLIAA